MIHIKGTASFPRLNEPDTKFDPAGVYNTKLILSAEDGERLSKRFDKMRDQIVAEQEEKSKGKAPRLNDHPLNPEYDEDGNETGNWVLSAKMKASGVSKKTNKPWSRKLPIFDSEGNPTNVKVTGGSEVILAIEPTPYAMAGKEKGKPIVTCGVSLRLEACQVIKLGSAGGRDASGFGFGAVEGGFVASEDDEPTTAPEAPSSEDGETGEDYDF